jgi:uncharacterized protein YbjT (DUF2867 family)
VLVTGATGYTGSGIADALVAAGHRVSGLARSDELARKLEERGIRAVRGDITDAGSLREAARGAEAVVHAALMHPRTLRLDSLVRHFSSLSGSTHSEYSGPGSPSG